MIPEICPSSDGIVPKYIVYVCFPLGEFKVGLNRRNVSFVDLKT